MKVVNSCLPDNMWKMNSWHPRWESDSQKEVLKWSLALLWRLINSRQGRSFRLDYRLLKHHSGPGASNVACQQDGPGSVLGETLPLNQRMVNVNPQLWTGYNVFEKNIGLDCMKYIFQIIKSYSGNINRGYNICLNILDMKEWCTVLF